MSATKERAKRSEKMSKQERSMFSKRVFSFDTKIDAAEYFGFSTVTLDAVLLKGSGRPNTIKMIREKLSAAE